MNDWVSLHTFIAFLLGVLAANWVKTLFAQVKGKVAG